MIIVTGEVVIRPDAIDAATALALDHVHRSRAEPGCLLHSVHRDVEDPNRLVFLEHWADLDALRAHFGVEASLDFVNGLAELAVAPATLQVYEATPTSV